MFLFFLLDLLPQVPKNVIVARVIEHDTSAESFAILSLNQSFEGWVVVGSLIFLRFSEHLVTRRNRFRMFALMETLGGPVAAGRVKMGGWRRD